MTPEQDERVGAALWTLPRLTGLPRLFECVADGEIHQTSRRMRFQLTNIIDAAASHHACLWYHGFVESPSRRPPRGWARRSENVRTRFSSSMKKAYHRIPRRKLDRCTESAPGQDGTKVEIRNAWSCDGAGAFFSSKMTSPWRTSIAGCCRWRVSRRHTSSTGGPLSVRWTNASRI